MSDLQETLRSEQLHYSIRKAEIAEARIRLDEEEYRLDQNMHKLVDVIMAHSEIEIPLPRSEIDE